MAKRARTTAAVMAQKETVWRERFARHAAGGQSVVTFCRSEGVAEGTFYTWRTRLRSRDADTAAPSCTAASTKASPSFIDLGSVQDVNVRDAVRSTTPAKAIGSSIAVRIDLDGVVLTITRS